MWSRLKEIFLTTSLCLFYWIYSRFWFVKQVRFPQPPVSTRPLIYAHWHGDELLLIAASAHLHLAVMASRSRDGQRQTVLLNFLGYKVVRGSSSKGGAGGLKGLIDAVMKNRYSAAVAVDGPRGPIYRVKLGVLKLAQETGALIIPAAAAAGRRYVFKKAWNQCYLPLPFSHCAVVYGEPLAVSPQATREDLEKLRSELESRMLAVKKEAESRYSRQFDPQTSKVLQPV